ncbi:unnamed protein product [Moneuplotes crassus]|uniref:Uncharacterized protein n=1 Tax=Euplotes crassus TaxID=5936 RepID=A0AAD2D8K5_EUPCR|nr:unnamed protein product [Moneuplotes crassus]
MEKEEQQNMQNLLNLTRDKRHKHTLKSDDESGEGKSKSKMSKSRKSRSKITSQFLEENMRIFKESGLGKDAKPPDHKREVSETAKRKNISQKPLYDLTEEELQLVEKEKQKKLEEKERMKEAVRMKNEARKRVKTDMKVSINDLGSTKNYKTLSSTEEVHNFVEKYGIAKYSKMIQVEKERLKHLGNARQQSNLDNKINAIVLQKKKKKSRMRFDVFNSAAVLLKPEVDASEKQILAKNNFLSSKNKVKLMMATDQFLDFNEFEPEKKGQYSQPLNPMHKKKTRSVPRREGLKDSLPPILEVLQADEADHKDSTKPKAKNREPSPELREVRPVKQEINGRIDKKTTSLQGRLKNVISKQNHFKNRGPRRKDYEEFLKKKQNNQEEDDEEVSAPFTNEQYSVGLVKPSSLSNEGASHKSTFENKMYSKQGAKLAGSADKQKHKKTRSKEVSTAYDRETLFNKLDPIFQKYNNGQIETLNHQANIKDRVREVTTDVNKKEVEQFINQDYYSLIQSKKIGRTKQKEVFYCNKINPIDDKSLPMLLKDETESGQEYFKFENDPHSHLRDQISQYSENYVRDRYFFQKNNKPFLLDAYKTGHRNQNSAPGIIKQATFETSSLLSKESSGEIFTQKDILELPKLSHTGTKVRPERERVSKEELKIRAKLARMEYKIKDLKQDFNQKHRKLNKFVVLKKDSEGRFTKVAKKRAKIKKYLKQQEANKREGKAEVVFAEDKLDEIEIEMKKQAAIREKKAKLEALKKSKMLKAQKLTINQLKKLQKHINHKTYATKKRVWEGNGLYFCIYRCEREIKERDLKTYFKKFDANQIFVKKKMDDYKVVKSDDEKD